MKLRRAAVAVSLSALTFGATANPVAHVLLISVDGMHALDLRNFVKAHPGSALAKLAGSGIEYSRVRTPVPADSFPGIVALMTGGTPEVTGVYFDDSYSRHLSPPGSTCSQRGTPVVFDESVDDPRARGGDAKLDPSRLPLDPKTCRPVYPHSYLRVNTVFEVVSQAGGYTAWIDKHPVYEILQGPSGKGLNDLFTPEIGANFEGNADRITASIAGTERYDTMKVDALLNEIAGRRHDGVKAAPVPTVFGLNLQEVNVAQKLVGYKNAQGKPAAGLEGAFANTDRLIGKIVSSLAKHGLTGNTLIVITAKHGNGPIDPSRIRHIDEKTIAATIEKAAPGALAKMTYDRAALIWLRNPEKTAVIARALYQDRARLGTAKVLYDNTLDPLFPLPRNDSRVPDIVLIPGTDIIYAKAGDDKKAEHGGFSSDDTDVALLISNPSIPAPGRMMRTPVATTQVAPTILASLGLNPQSLQAVMLEGTPLLPGISWSALSK